jgi:hypothetical protein
MVAGAVESGSSPVTGSTRATSLSTKEAAATGSVGRYSSAGNTGATGGAGQQVVS